MYARDTSSSSVSISTFIATNTTVSGESATPSSTSSTVGQPSQTVPPQTDQDIVTIRDRRVSIITEGLSGGSSIEQWYLLSTLGPDGKWPASEVDYTTGCDARRANWPAETHWQRIVTMTAAWQGGLDGTPQYVNNTALRSSISLAMDYWFENDFTNPGCLYQGGTSPCPCGTPGLWNTNWFSNIILIPTLVGQGCLLLGNNLTTSQLGNCTRINGRAYGSFGSGQSFLAGANILDIAKVGIDDGLLTNNISLLSDAFGRIHNEVVIHNAVAADGIRPDGSFGQHVGVLYNGNYGMVYTNDVLGIEIEAGGTTFAANSTSRNAFAVLIDGDQWMIFRNVITGVLHWDFSALGRFISFPVIDDQPTANIGINLTQVLQLGQEWSSNTLINAYYSLSKNTTDANAGALKGNRMFYNNDYMVHRGAKYVSTLKMYSTRTQNTECVNTQNPLGFHLADGTLYTYLRGDEYEDIAASWDWYLIPGITVDYAATPLDCAHTGWNGAESFVGGASDGSIGASAMRYSNPYTGSLSWQKAWFFLDDDVQHVMISNITSKSNAAVYSVLDQKRHSGPIFVNGLPMQPSNYTLARSLWHDDVGYLFDNPGDGFQLSIEVGNRTGNWSTIGTSTQPPSTVDLFAAWIEHQNLETSVSYSILPAITLPSFETKALTLHLRTIQNDEHISAVYDESHQVVSAIFWDISGGSLQFAPSSWEAPVTIHSDGNAAVLYRVDSGAVTVSDPSQSLAMLHLTFTRGGGGKMSSANKTLTFNLPSGPLAGSSVSQTL
ncbi:polysaccharide lyase family 8 protein [Jaapia argillacea MUCL 33604]|uniref:Polysaccharide lyase family 8 protein n=1 Tax=Jaapia argillacea MUCL 33604 TaxID=933084 RepID=A0A067Q9S6_9AGAM|nr:polysaccharide lyase family 8 protein [Jaapia argillacea MUCL 33604]